MEAVQGAVDLGIKQLSGAAPVMNAVSGAEHQYAMPARTAADVTPGFIAAPADNPAPNNPQLVQQAMQAENNDMFAQLARVADPAQRQLGQAPPPQAMPQQQQPMQQTPSGLVLPAGMAPQPVQGVNNEQQAQSDESVGWLL